MRREEREEEAAMKAKDSNPRENWRPHQFSISESLVGLYPDIPDRPGCQMEASSSPLRPARSAQPVLWLLSGLSSSSK